MSTITLSSLNYISREDLARKLNDSFPASLAIIDVRDSDHIGGHIRGSTWIPSSELDYRVPELVRTLADKDTVVFHCALSQQRGPSAALRYLREKERLGEPTAQGQQATEAGTDADKEEGESENKDTKTKKQKVLVLRGGFTEWQEKYGADERLTEGWKRDIWEFGY